METAYAVVGGGGGGGACSIAEAVSVRRLSTTNKSLHRPAFPCFPSRSLPPPLSTSASASASFIRFSGDGDSRHIGYKVPMPSAFEITSVFHLRLLFQKLLVTWKTRVRVYMISLNRGIGTLLSKLMPGYKRIITACAWFKPINDAKQKHVLARELTKRLIEKDNGWIDYINCEIYMCMQSTVLEMPLHHRSRRRNEMVEETHASMRW